MTKRATFYPFPSLICLFMLSLTMCTTQDERHQKTATPRLPEPGLWRIVMLSPGGDLPFLLTLSENAGQPAGTIHNGKETLPLDILRFNADGTFTFGIDHYESFFTGTISEDGKEIFGEWTKVSGQDKISRLPFRANHGEVDRFITTHEDSIQIPQKWSVTFDNQGDPQSAVGLFHQNGKKVEGTFLTPTGDYRFLEGVMDGNELKLSCFDGGHAFLFQATLQEDGTLAGDFWSRDTWHETWTAKPDADVTLPEDFADDPQNIGAKFRFHFENLAGEMMDQDHPQFREKVLIVTLFGSWCPNCNDEAPFLAHLYDEYKAQGLEIVGLAFEFSQDQERNRRVLRRFKQRHNINYPILLAGTSSDKQKAADLLPDLAKLEAYPTTLFIDRQGVVRAMHIGFSGPGTGTAFSQLKEKYRAQIKALL